MTERDARLPSKDVSKAAPSGRLASNSGGLAAEAEVSDQDAYGPDLRAADAGAASPRSRGPGDDSGQARTGGASPEAARLIALTAGVLANIQTVVGEGAAQALFRYGGFEEGKRVARASGIGRFDQALQSFDELLGHASTGTTTDDGAVEVQLTGCVIEEEQRALDIVLLGLYEGLLHAVFQARYKGRILGRQSGGRALLRFDRDPTTA